MDVRKVVEGAASGRSATAIFDRLARLACREDILLGVFGNSCTYRKL